MASLFRLIQFAGVNVARRVLGATLAGLLAVVCSMLLPLVIMRLVDSAINDNQRKLVIPLGAIGLALGCVQLLAIFIRKQLAATTSLQMETALRGKCFSRIQTLSISDSKRWQDGQIIARLTSDLASVSRFTGNSLVFLAYAAATFCGITVMLAILSPLLAAITSSAMVVLILTGRQFNRRGLPAARCSGNAVGEFTSAVDESVKGIRVLRGLGQESHAVARIANSALMLRNRNLEVVHIRSFYLSLLDIIPGFLLGAVFWFGGMQVIRMGSWSVLDEATSS